MLLLLVLSSFAEPSPGESPAASGDSGWITPEGPVGLTWGTSSVPFDAVPRKKNIMLPDSDFLGVSKSDKPDDLEVPAPKGERHFLRYVHGTLSDAWWVSDGPIDPGPVVGWATPEWTGIVLGPAEGGYLAFGVTSSWTVNGRTVLHWRDKEGTMDILASRSAPTPQYGLNRPTPLKPPEETGSKVSLSGDFKAEAKPYAGRLASCLDNARKPVVIDIVLKLDARGQIGRIKIESDQTVFGINECVSGALMDLKGTPSMGGTLSAQRFK